MEKALTERFWEMKFGLLRSFYYYEARLLFWSGALTFCYIVEAAIVILCLFQVIPVEWKTASATALALVGTTLGGYKRIKTLRRQKRAMGDCLSLTPYREKDETGKLFQKIKNKRESAERQDDILFETLDAICDNKARMTLGVADRYEISGMRAFWGWWLPLPYPKNLQPIGK